MTIPGGHTENVDVTSPAQAVRPVAANPAQIEAIYEEQMDYVWSSLRSLGVRVEDAEDLTHDVFVQTFLSIDRYDPARPIRPWLFGIAYRVAIDHLRRAHHRREVHDPAPERSDGRPEADAVLAVHEDRERLVAALQDLPIEQRALLTLYYLHEQSIAEIAEVFPVPHQTLYSRLKAARERLREALARRNEGIAT